MSESKMHRPDPRQGDFWADQIQTQYGGLVYARSLVIQEGTTVFLHRSDQARSLWLAWEQTPPAWVKEFQGPTQRLNLEGQVLTAKQCPTDAATARMLRRYFPFTKPQLVGLEKSFGFGDRLGLATPGHILALGDSGLRPIFAQQSIREMTRTKRTAQQVMDDASWGVFQVGFDRPFGSDADHLKNETDIDTCAAAGFLLFTIDPGEHVDDQADVDGSDLLQSKFDALPWSVLETTASDTLRRYEGTVNLSSGTLPFDREHVLRAAVKYGKAIAHACRMYRHLQTTRGTGNFELEVSVDETASPTSPQEHFYVARELRRLGVQWVALAPRFVGRFEKGVDYIGDLDEFYKEFVHHVQIACEAGPYKLSIHSGSDKFSIYPIASELAGNLIHVKTAGTSYLEALRVIAKLEPDLFRKILDFARGRYLEDRASYHVSADLDKVPPARDLSDYHLSQLLDDFDAREVLHVTFGSVLTSLDAAGQPRFRDALLRGLTEHEEAYHQCLRSHLGRHVEPFTK